MFEKFLPLHPLSGMTPGATQERVLWEVDIQETGSSTRSGVLRGRRCEPSMPRRTAAGVYRAAQCYRIGVLLTGYRPCHKMVGPGRDRFYNVEFDPGSG